MSRPTKEEAWAKVEELMDADKNDLLPEAEKLPHRKWGWGPDSYASCHHFGRLECRHLLYFIYGEDPK